MATGDPMTEAEVRAWMEANGVGDIANDEAGYIASHYAGVSADNPFHDMTSAREAQLAALAEGLPSYTQRHRSGGDRSDPRNYSTDLNDPEVTIGGHTAPARYDSEPLAQLRQMGWAPSRDSAALPTLSALNAMWPQGLPQPKAPAGIQRPDTQSLTALLQLIQQLTSGQQNTNDPAYQELQRKLAQLGLAPGPTSNTMPVPPKPFPTLP